mgnify:CR=1 FL=1
MPRNARKKQDTGGGFGKAGTGRGRGGGNRAGAGPGGKCVCPSCGAVVPHSAGRPCYETACPECGAAMVRED